MEIEFVWDVPPEKMIEQLANDYVTAIHNGLVAIAQLRAPEITTWMQQNRPWTDRTDVARLGLDTTVEDVELELVELLLAHGAYHGWYLEGINPATLTEMMNAGEWAILAPAIDHWGPIILEDIQKMLR